MKINDRKPTRYRLFRVVDKRLHRITSSTNFSKIMDESTMRVNKGWNTLILTETQ